MVSIFWISAGDIFVFRTLSIASVSSSENEIPFFPAFEAALRKNGIKAFVLSDSDWDRISVNRLSFSAEIPDREGSFFQLASFIFATSFYIILLNNRE